jgi:hypothetical protein
MLDRVTAEGDDRYRSRSGFQKGNSRIAECPAAGFARVNKQAILLVSADTRLVGVAKHRNIPVVGLTPKLPLHVANDESRAVRRRMTHRRLGHVTDGRIARHQTDLIALVVAKAAHEGTGEPTERRDGERRTQVSSKDYELAAGRIKLRNRQANVRQMIVRVGKQSNEHRWSQARFTKPRVYPSLVVLTRRKDRPSAFDPRLPTNISGLDPISLPALHLRKDSKQKELDESA